ncbi:MAG: hemagglutinin repeat-containing protein, partial [Veillonella sp.]|nr:hemagglutinin repeat-containing protein [Veillonella sp.]
RDAQQSGIGLTGETVEAKKLVLDSASDINLEAGKNTVDVNNAYKSSGWSVGAGISLTGGGLLDINASGHMARQNGDTHQESYVPTKIKAAQLAQLKAKRDTNIIGSTVSGKKVEVDTGRDLYIQSLQDVDNFKEHSKSAGFSVSSKPNFKNPTGSINASVGRIDSKWKSVTEQAGIYAGEEGYNINVGNNTTLEGAVIKSEAPKAKNKLTTKSLEMKDIKNEAEYTYSNNGIGYNYYGSKKKLEEMKTKDKKGYDKIYNSIGLVPNLGVGSKGKASSTTQSAISDGILTVDGKEIDTKTINTNTENTLHQLDKIFDKKKIEERQELARLFSKNAFEQLHNWQPTTKDGKIAKSIAHGIIGEVAARMAGNSPGSGFKATMTNELLIGEIKKVAKHDPALAQWLSAAVGGVVNKASGENANAGSAVASYATKWNEGLLSIPETRNSIINDTRINNFPLGEGQGLEVSANVAHNGAVTGYMMFHADGGNPVFEVTTYTEGLGLNLPLSIKGARIWLTDSNGYKVVDPNIIIQEVSGSSVSGDWNLLLSYNTTPTPGGYTLHVVGAEGGAHVSVNRTVVKFVGYQNQL